MAVIHTWNGYNVFEAPIPPLTALPSTVYGQLFPTIANAGWTLLRTIGEVQFTWDQPGPIPPQVPPQFYWAVYQYKTNNGAETPITPGQDDRSFVWRQVIPTLYDYIVAGQPDPLLRLRGFAQFDSEAQRLVEQDGAPLSVSFEFEGGNANELLANMALQYRVRQLWRHVD
jgi:hypothetical protein